MQVDQTTFRAAVLDPATPRPPGLVDGRGAPAGRRFDVYRNNVAVSLTEALETAFPVIRKLVGEANFKVIAGSYLRAHPPSSPLMMFYGQEMPDFLAAFAPTAKTAYLPDTARLELALRESYHAADARPIDASALQAMSPDALMAARLTLAPSLRLIRSRWPIHAIWRFNTEDGAPRPAMAAEDVAVLRAEYDPVPVLLPPGSGAILAALVDGAPLGTALEASPEADLATLLGLLLSHDAITNIGGPP